MTTVKSHERTDTLSESAAAIKDEAINNRRDERALILKTATDTLLDPDSTDGDKNCAIGSLYTLFSEITGLDAFSELEEDVTDTYLDHGLALSPRGAGRCIFHNERTARYLRGLHDAIVEAQKRFPSSVIHVLYAGCGPYATLAIPLTTKFSANEVQFTLLDIHQKSLDCVRTIADALGISSYIKGFIRCDAAEYRHPNDDLFHIAVTETMQKALIKEPQVAITLNLVPQLATNGILIPEKVTLDIGLAEISPDAGTDPDKVIVPEESIVSLGKAFEINKEIAGQMPTLLNNGNGAAFPPAVIRINEDVSGNRKVAILTSITVFGSIELRTNESWLTFPTPIFEIGEIKEGTEIEFRYSLGNNPGLRYRFI
ncbi:MAG TPA: hypothetical protein VFC63_23200 [Blastocatellia bacterium]|nr:hypothetical protein [Blastocatellia bacterium]